MKIVSKLDEAQYHFFYLCSSDPLLCVRKDKEEKICTKYAECIKFYNFEEEEKEVEIIEQTDNDF
jgi:hypothetical protein